MKIFVLALTALTLAGPAFASPCGDKIASLKSRYDAAPPVQGAAPLGGGADAETTGAKLHHQPEAASAADANTPALSPQNVRNAEFKVALEEAIAADHAGDAAGCETAAARAQRALSP